MEQNYLQQGLSEDEELRRSEEAFDRVWQEDSPAFVTYKWNAINKMVFPEAKWRIGNLIPMQGLVVLSAVSGGKKSWLALEMAKSICQGINFLGTDKFPAIKGNVLYIDCENPRAEIQRRGRQLGFKDEDNFHILSRDNLTLNNDENVLEMTHTIIKNSINVVFVDTFRAAAGGLKEEKAEEVREFFNRFKPFKDKGVAIVFLDHFRKPSNFDGKVPKKEFLLGSVDKTASVEILLMLHSESGSQEISMYQRKNRLGKEIEPFKIIMADTVTDEKTSTALTYDGEIADEVNKKEEAKELIISMLEGSEGLETNALILALQKQVGQKNIRQALKELTKEGLLSRDRKGKQYHYFLPKDPTFTTIANDF